MIDAVELFFSVVIYSSQFILSKIIIRGNILNCTHLSVGMGCQLGGTMPKVMFLFTLYALASRYLHYPIPYQNAEGFALSVTCFKDSYLS